MRRRIALLLLVVLLLTSCALPPQAAALRASRPDRLPAAVHIDRVPFFAQADHACGPAALAMTLAAEGLEVTPQQLDGQLLGPARGGTLGAELRAVARRHGRLAVMLPPTLAALFEQVADGHPVIVLQNLSLPILPLWHYAVVIGFDLERDEIALHSGRSADLRMPVAQFERTWARSGYWAMVAQRPALPSAVLPLEALLPAAMALERVDRAAARDAYEALTVRAPQAWSAWFGLGNAALLLGDARAAIAAFTRAAELQPASADVWNNLAAARQASGEFDSALEAINRALALGGPRHARYEQTRDEIEHEHAAASR